MTPRRRSAVSLLLYVAVASATAVNKSCPLRFRIPFPFPFEPTLHQLIISTTMLKYSMCKYCTIFYCSTNLVYAKPAWGQFLPRSSTPFCAWCAPSFLSPPHETSKELVCDTYDRKTIDLNFDADTGSEVVVCKESRCVLGERDIIVVIETRIEES